MKKDTVLSSLFLIAALLLTVLYIKPLIDQDSELDPVVQDTSNMLTEAESAFNHAREVKDNFDRMTEADKEKATKRVPNTVEQQSIIDELSALAQKNNLILSSITFSKVAGTDTYKKISIAANFSSLSEKDQSVNFLEGLETTDRLFSVKNISLLLGKGRSDYSVTLEAYYRM